MITIDPQLAQVIIGAIGLLIAALIGGAALLIRNLGELRASKIRQQTAESENQTKLTSARTEIEAIKLANEAAELRRQAEAAQMQADFNKKLQESNEQLKNDMHTLTVNFTAQISELRGENKQLTRVQEVLDTRLRQTSEQKLEMAQQVSEYQKRIEQISASEQASTLALNKANEMLQHYEKQRVQDQATITDLQGKLTDTTLRIGALENEVKQLKLDADARHNRASEVSARNARLFAYNKQYQIVLNAIWSAMPMRDWPPHVIADLSQHGIDVQRLVNLRFDDDIPEPPADKMDTPTVPLVPIVPPISPA